MGVERGPWVVLLPIKRISSSRTGTALITPVVETDRFKVLELVQAADDAISKRLERIAERSGDEVERRAIFEALGKMYTRQQQECC
jgi:hypothetical protein